jgi:hypothetical protein
MHVDYTRGVVMSYFIIREANTADLSYEVEYYIKVGWKLQGGVAMTSHQSKLTYCQAMTKED